MIAGSDSESCKRYKSNPNKWAGEKEKENGRVRKKRKNRRKKEDKNKKSNLNQIGKQQRAKKKHLNNNNSILKNDIILFKTPSTDGFSSVVL